LCSCFPLLDRKNPCVFVLAFASSRSCLERASLCRRPHSVTHRRSQWTEAKLLGAGTGMAAAPPPKADELQPFPPKEQLPGVAFCITSPPPWRTCFFSTALL
jgi:hypothetical protein